MKVVPMLTLGHTLLCIPKIALYLVQKKKIQKIQKKLRRLLIQTALLQNGNRYQPAWSNDHFFLSSAWAHSFLCLKRKFHFNKHKI